MKSPKPEATKRWRYTGTNFEYTALKTAQLKVGDRKLRNESHSNLPDQFSNWTYYYCNIPDPRSNKLAEASIKMSSLKDLWNLPGNSKRTVGHLFK
jgi:hypothetical protein